MHHPGATAGVCHPSLYNNLLIREGEVGVRGPGHVRLTRDASCLHGPPDLNKFRGLAPTCMSKQTNKSRERDTVWRRREGEKEDSTWSMLADS